MLPTLAQRRNGRGPRKTPEPRPATASTSRKGQLLDPADVLWLRRRLLRWYYRHARPWPWRASTNSYEVWVAEVMLQQTRVEVVGQAFPRFMARFPRLAELASAPLEEVLAAWSGLGYYQRARNLHRAAQWLWQRGYSEFPREPAVARALPGVGSYTAAAVLSIAYNKPLAAVDANARRVLRRLVGLTNATNSEELCQQLALALLNRRVPGHWNQALMELGQRCCTPQAPQCRACPWQGRCASAQSSNFTSTASRPRRRSTPERMELDADLVFDATGRIAIERGVFPYLRHLWLPLLHRRATSSPDMAAHRGRLLGTIRHAIGKRQFSVSVYCRTISATEGSELLRKVQPPGERRWVTAKELEHLGRSSLLLKCWVLWQRLESERLASGRAKE